MLLLFIESLLQTYGGQSQFPFSSRTPVTPSAHSQGGGVVGGGVVPGVVPVYGVVLSPVGGVVALVVPVTVVRFVVPTVVAVPVVNFVVATVVVVRSVVVGGGVVGHLQAG